MESTKSLSNWQHLEEFGIICLTGEACGMTMRILCDLTEEGRQLLTQFFGGNVQFMDGSNWNSSKGAVASVLLPYEIFHPLAGFCLFKAGYRTIAKLKNAVVGVDQERVEQEMRDCGVDVIYKDWRGYVSRFFGEAERYWITAGTSRAGDRNVHEMSGRVS